MKATTKVIIAGAVLVGIGIVILLVAGFATSWSFDQDVNWEHKTYECEENVSNLDIDFSAGRIKVEFYDGDKVKVEYAENKRVTTECNVKNQTLKIKSVVHFHVQFWSFNQIPETKIYIPKNMILGLKLNADAGTISIGAGTFADVTVKMDAGTVSLAEVNCNSFDLKMDAGTMNVSQIQCDKFNAKLDAGTMNVSKIQCNTFKANLDAGTLKVTSVKCDDIDLDLSAGTIKLGIVGKKSDYTILVDKSAGSCNVSSQSGGSKRLTVDISAGSVNVSFDE